MLTHAIVLSSFKLELGSGKYDTPATSATTLLVSRESIFSAGISMASLLPSASRSLADEEFRLVGRKYVAVTLSQQAFAWITEQALAGVIELHELQVGRVFREHHRWNAIE